MDDSSQPLDPTPAAPGWSPPPEAAGHRTADGPTDTGADAPAGRRRPRRWPGVILAVVGLGAAGYGGLMFRAASDADARTEAARGRATRLERERTRTDARTETVNHTADGPIGVAERLAGSASQIAGASGTVIDKANHASDVLGRAVDAANAGNLGTARNLYDGEGADAIRALQEVLTAAQVVLQAARDAAAELQTGVQ